MERMKEKQRISVLLFVCQVETREDEEQNIKLTEILELLVAAGYFRARIKGLSPFDKVRPVQCFFQFSKCMRIRHFLLGSLAVLGDFKEEDACNIRGFPM